MINNDSSIPLPEEILKATEQAQNNLTLANAEVQRLTRLKSQIEKEISVKDSERIVLENKVTDLQAKSNKLTSDNVTLQESVKNANLTLENIKAEQSTVQANITQQQADLADKISKYLADREQLTQDQTVLNLDKELFAKEQEEHKVKKSFLQEILTKI